MAMQLGNKALRGVMQRLFKLTYYKWFYFIDVCYDLQMLYFKHCCV